MKRILLAVAAMAVLAVGSNQTASANHPSLYPFVPFGFYQPYGARIGASLPTPPYFALNPPVYYGARHARPYGMSPFAAPPMVSPGQNYQGRLRTGFYQPPTEAPAAGGPCVIESAKVPVKRGLVRTNPFFTDEQLAKK